MKSTIKIAAIAALLFSAVFPAAAQLQGQQQGQTTTTNSQSGASNQGNNQGMTFNEAAAPANTTSRLDGHQRIDTTPSVIPPSIGNASGQYNCFGSASAGFSVTGFGVSGGSTTSQIECYRNHLMDKAAARAQSDPKFVQVWDALFCMFPDGATAYAASGKSCPQDEAAKKQQAALVQQNSQQVVLKSQGQPGVYTGNDPIVKARLGVR